ncbi:Radical SAM domain protein [Desulfofarcimen acetoxidans DSM 771]|uniref:Radical SAM domain protein n=1 Tax=Desulfofarcimen acetoxidans (strain ATCC 49208 / DSM 771 / KCTC 5769 / VKM B-1644 / 5575) TaxID=485916 RepID=C8W369_DESAS|nr:radical SAM protein [Desulfofarcimen acetoxidans]ACV61836.1 Radical SAM domain protein [Desulfofarcimen acetoxidans DSM 771]
MGQIDPRLHLFEVDGSNYAVSTEYMRFAGIDPETAAVVRLGGPAEPVLSRLGVPLEPCGRKRFLFAPPDTLVLMLTYACNMACRYCCQGEIPDIRENQMSEAVSCRSVDWLIRNSAGSKTVNIGFFGGEPLLKFSLMQKIAVYAERQAAAADKRVRYGIMTNGLLLTDPVIDFLAERQVEVTVSFDGPPAVQDRNRPLKGGGGSFHLIAEKIRKLLARCPDATLRPTLYAGADLDEVLQTARQLGFRQCRIEKVSSSLLPEGKKNDEAASSGQLAAHLRRQGERFLTAVRDRDAAGLRRIAVDGAFMEGLRQMFHADWAGTVRRRWFSCGTGRQLLAVAVNGDLYPCPRFLALPEYRVGSVAEDGFQGELHQKSLLIHSEDCRSCWARYFCGGACIVEHLGGTGSIFRVNPNTCRLRRARIETAVRVIAECSDEDKAFLQETGVLPGRLAVKA